MEMCSRCGWRCTSPCPEFCPVCGVQLVIPGDSPIPIVQPPPPSSTTTYSTKITFQYALGHGITRGVTIIGIISIVMYLFTQMNPKYLYPTLGFVPAYAIGRFMPWQFVTANFMHADLTHLFMNMFGLITFGGAVEKVLKEKEFIKYFRFFAHIST